MTIMGSFILCSLWLCTGMKGLTLIFCIVMTYDQDIEVLFNIFISNIHSTILGNCRDFDFENGKRTLSKWRKTGHAFDDQPTYGDNAHVRNPDITTNVQGDWWIGTFENRSSPNEEGGYLKGDFPIGTLTSPKFRITGPKMSFLLGGGCDPGRIRVELLINGEVAREASVDNCLDHMRRREWDVSAFKNKIAQIRLVDGSRKGHINFDDLWGDFTCIGEFVIN